ASRRCDPPSGARTRHALMLDASWPRTRRPNAVNRSLPTNGRRATVKDSDSRTRRGSGRVTVRARALRPKLGRHGTPRTRTLRSRYSLLWIDLTVSVHDSETLEAFESFFRVHRDSALASIDSEIARLKPDALCFDYDYPTKQSLQALQE